MKVMDSFRAAKQIPMQIKETTNLLIGMVVVSLLAFLMAGIALMNSGVRYAN